VTIIVSDGRATVNQTAVDQTDEAPAEAVVDTEE